MGCECGFECCCCFVRFCWFCFGVRFVGLVGGFAVWKGLFILFWVCGLSGGCVVFWFGVASRYWWVWVYCCGLGFWMGFAFWEFGVVLFVTSGLGVFGLLSVCSVGDVAGWVTCWDALDLTDVVAELVRMLLFDGAIGLVVVGYGCVCGFRCV